MSDWMRAGGLRWASWRGPWAVVVALVMTVGVREAAGVPVSLLAEGRRRALEAGHLRGMVGVELLRPDLIVVILDGAVVGDPANTEDPAVEAALGGGAAALERPGAFRVEGGVASGYAGGAEPVAVHRASYEWFNAYDRQGNWPLAVAAIRRHDYFLRLPRPLKAGETYRVAVTGGVEEPRARRAMDLAYDPAVTVTRAIKVNTVGYSAASGRRYGYLGWWQGSGGAVDYSEYSRYEVVAEPAGAVVLTGEMELRAELDPLSGEQVKAMNLSGLPPGRYRVRVPGLAVSEPFTVGGLETFEVFYHTARAFLHQRSGQELREPWTAYARPAWYLKAAEDGRTEKSGVVEGPDVRAFPGGYHDAADYDVFAYHLPAVHLLLLAYEANPRVFVDGQLNLPESGNGVPDLLDEAAWGLRFHLENQEPSGLVPLGRINGSDALKQNLEPGSPQPPYGILPPSRSSTTLFAAVAAAYARIAREVDPAGAARHLVAARRAYAAASKRTAQQVWEEQRVRVPGLKFDPKDEVRWKETLVWAAAELYAATGEPEYGAHVDANARIAGAWPYLGQMFVSYLGLPEAKTTPATRAVFLDKLLRAPGGADRILASTEEGVYRMGNGRGTQVGWGAANGLAPAVQLLHAYRVTGERKYLDGASLQADFHCGVNPLGRSHVTGMGAHPPNRPEINAALYLHRDGPELLGGTVRGISIYGIGPPVKEHPGPGADGVAAPGWEKGWPLWRSWRDVWATFAEIYSEFTVHQTLGPAAYLYSTLYAEEVKAGRLTGRERPRFPLGAPDR